MTDLVVFGASCVVVGMAAGILIGLWAPPPRRREALPALTAVHDVTPQPLYLRLVEYGYGSTGFENTLAERGHNPTVTFYDAEALGWLGEA